MSMWVLSRAANEVKKCFSVPIQICTALGITSAVFSLVMAVTSRHGMVTAVSQRKMLA